MDLSGAGSAAPAFERLAPAKPDERPKDSICYMCDGDINPKTLVTVQTDKGPVRLCGPHCYFIMYSCLTEDKTGFEKKVTVTDWATGKPVPTFRGRLSLWRGRDHGQTLDQGLRRPGCRRRGTSRQRRKRPGPGGAPAEGTVPSLRILRPGVLSAGCRRGHRRRRTCTPGAAAPTVPWAWRPGPARTSRSTRKTA